MSTANNQIFRIKYEAFSKFSNNLNRCRTFEEIGECFNINLKYLFNYKVFRVSYHRNGTYIHMDTTLSGTKMSVSNSANYFDYERLLLKNGMPFKCEITEALMLPDTYNFAKEDEPELWGWNFTNEKRQIIVSIVSTNSRKFSNNDINFLKLVSDNLESKLFEFCLINELDEKNGIISKINEDQKEEIKQRTKEIEEKNKTLLEISVLNAHNVREPLARILGLINLLDIAGENGMEEVIPLLKISSTDLDRALKSVIDHATKDLMKLKA